MLNGQTCKHMSMNGVPWWAEMKDIQCWAPEIPETRESFSQSAQVFMCQAAMPGLTRLPPLA